MKKLAILLFTFSLLSFQSVKSEEFYIGIDYFNNEIDSGITNISSTLDEKDNGYSLYAGMPISETMDIEVSYNDFGEASLTGLDGQQFIYEGTTYEWLVDASLAVKASSIGVAAKQKYELSEGVMLYGKLGVHQWDSELSIASTNSTLNADEDGTDVFYGVGLEVNLTNLKGRVGYSMYDLDGEEVDSINVGFSYNF